MKWRSSIASLSLAAGLSLAATNSPSDADVFIVSSNPRPSSHDAPPHLPRQLVRHILLQRTAAGDDHSSLSADLPDDIDRDRALAYLNEFGREPMDLFGRDGNFRGPSMVLMLEGVTGSNAKGLRAGLASRGQSVAFVVDDAPSAAANRRLEEVDFAGIQSRCQDADDIDGLLTPRDSKCWTGNSLFAKHDVAKHPSFLSSVTSNLNKIIASTSAENMDIMVILVPEITRTAGSEEWTSVPSDLRRRQATETVITDHQRDIPKQEKAAVFASSADPLQSRKIPACFASASACMNATASCSGHGSCDDRYNPSKAASLSVRADDSKKLVCFQCMCAATVDEGKGTTHWAGKTCAKQDVSVQFWLLAGLTIGLMGIVSFAVGLLFSVGEEKLPGVIGAGVSRPTK